MERRKRIVQNAKHIKLLERSSLFTNHRQYQSFISSASTTDIPSGKRYHLMSHFLCGAWIQENIVVKELTFKHQLFMTYLQPPIILELLELVRKQKRDANSYKDTTQPTARLLMEIGTTSMIVMYLQQMQIKSKVVPLIFSFTNEELKNNCNLQVNLIKMQSVPSLL